MLSKLKMPFSKSNRPAKKHPEILRYEELEQRVLFSADVAPGMESAIVEEQVVAVQMAEDGLDERAVDPETTEAVDAQPLMELVVVNDNVADYETLLADLQGDDDNRIIEVVVLDSQRDGIEQVSEILSERTDLASIHFVTHGTDAQINLGNSWLNSTSLQANRDDVVAWGDALSESGDILFYGCSIAADGDGTSLLDDLAQLTGADVAASEDATGNEELGGDWDLEYSQGRIESNIAFSESLQQSWQGTLATYNVTNMSELRQAIIDANSNVGADTIYLSAGLYEFTGSKSTDMSEDLAALGDLDITEDVTIIGAGMTTTTIDAATIDRIFHVHGGASLTLQNIRLTGGDSHFESSGGLYGGAIMIESGASAILESVDIDNNTAVEGGAIYNQGTLTMTGCIVQNSTTSLGYGGGINNDGGTVTLNNVAVVNNQANKGGGLYIGDGSTSTLTNVTVSGNTAVNSGGGIQLENNTTVDLIYSTVAGNHSDNQWNGGGIKIDNGGTLNMLGTIAADNTAGTSTVVDSDINGDIVSQGYNLIEDIDEVGSGIDANDITGVDPNLDALADNGGNTLTHALLAGSAAINAGTTTGAPATDQRGNMRDDSDSYVDIGAYEYSAVVDNDPPAQVNNTGSTVAEGGTDTIGTTELRYDDSQQSAANVTYTVTGGLANGQLELTGNPGVAVTSFTQAQIDANEVVYVHDGSNTTSDSFNFSVDDGQGNALAGQTFAITITAVDDDVPTAVNQSMTVAEGASDVALTAINLSSTDTDTDDTILVYTVGDVTNGALTINGSAWAAGINDSFTQQDIIDGKVFYSHDGSNTTSDGFSYSVADPTGNTLGGQIFTITVIGPSGDLSSGIELNNDGGNDAYLISDGDLDRFLSAATFEIRFAATDIPRATTFMSYYNSDGSEFSVRHSSFNDALRVKFGETVLSEAIDYSTILDGNIHTLSVAWDNTVGDWSVYVDGALVDSGTGLNTGAALDVSDGRFVFGNEQDAPDGGYDSGQYLAGTIYDVRIWDKVRSADEIARNYQHRIDSGTLPGGLVANWQMDGFDGFGQVVDVVSGNNLSVSHVSGAGFMSSTFNEEMHVFENATDGTIVGHVVPRTADVPANADPVSYTFVLNDDASGRFAIDAGTGEIAVADSSQLDYESATSHDVSVRVTNALGDTYDEVFTIYLDDVDEAPVNTLPGAQTANEDTTLTFSTANGNAISISDDSGETPAVSVSVENGTLIVSGAGGASVSGDGTASVTLTGTVADINAALDGLQYVPAGDWNGTETLTISTTDGEMRTLDLDSELKGYYEFTAGDPAADSSPGGANGGTLIGDAAVVSDPQRGDVLSLDGDGDSLQISGLFSQPANVTLAAWVNLIAADTNGASVINIGQNVALRLNSASTGGLLTGVYYNGTEFKPISGPANTLAGKGWHHIAYVFDDVNDVHSIYLDGKLVVQESTTDSISYTQGYSDTFIGTPASGLAGYDFNGQIDEARIYSRALTDIEIAHLANAPDPLSDTDTVAITVNQANDAGTFGGDTSGSGAEDGGAITGTLTFTDAADGSSAPNFTVTGAASNGSVSIDNVTGVWSYTPAGDFNGTDSFTVQVTDDDSNTETQVISITVNPVNDVPTGSVIVDDTTPAEGQVLTATNTLADVDGMGSVIYTWRADGAVVGTGAAYTTTSSDVGKVITVDADYTDGDGTAETVTSAPTAAVSNTGNPATITGDTTYSGNEGDIATGDLDATDPDGLTDTTYFSIGTQATHGTASIDAETGAWTYTPADVDWFGSDSFIVTVTDDLGGTTGQVVNISLTNVNDVPVATANTVSTTEDTTYNFTAGDFTFSDVEGNSLVSATITNLFLAGGSLTHSGGTTVNSGDTLTAAQLDTLVYTPASNANGSPLATFDFTVNDAGAGSVAAQMAIDVTAVNDAPSGGNVTISVTEDTDYTFSLADFGFSDVDGNALDRVWFTALPTQGTLKFNGSAFAAGNYVVAHDISIGLLTYTPPADANGSSYTYFTFEVQDDGGTLNGGVDRDSTANTVSIDITPVNDAPTTSPVVLNPIDEDSGVRVITQAELLTNAADAEGDSLTAMGLTISSGLGSLADNGDGTWSYTPAADDVASVSFNYTITDGSDTVAGNATLDINPVNDNDPVAVDDSITVNEGATKAALDGGATSVLTNDSDLDLPDDTLKVALDTDVSHGSLTLNADGTFSYTHDGSENFSDAFTYIVSDGNGGATSTGTVAITVKPVNDPPNGEVTISGSRTVGQVLTADNTLADADGLNGSITYQWYRNGIAIDGASDTTYTAVQADVGTHITVTAVYTDDQGTLERITSTPAGPIAGFDNDASDDSELVFEDNETVETEESDAKGADDAKTEEDKFEEVESSPPLGEDQMPEASTTAGASFVLSKDPGTEAHEGIRYLNSEDGIDSEFERHTDNRAFVYFDNDFYMEKASEQYLSYNHDTFEDNTELIDLDDMERLNFSYENFDLLREEIDGTFRSEQQTNATKVKIVTASIATFTVGIVSYLLRAGSLFAGMVSTMPLWRGFDPVAVFSGEKKKDNKKDDNSGSEERKPETLFDGEKP